MTKGSLRVILGRDVEFGNQLRTAPVHVHPKCVAGELDNPECNTESDGLAERLRAHSAGLEDAQIAALLAEIGQP